MEINEQAFVTGMFIDRGDQPDEVEVTLITPLTTRLSSGQQMGASNEVQGRTYGSLSRKGKTIAEALHKIQTNATRELSWGHTRIVVISADYAKSGIQPLLEWITRQPSFLLKTYLLVAPNKAKEIINLTPVYESDPAEVLREFSNQEYLLSTSIREMIMGVLIDQGAAVTLLTSKELPMVSEMEKKSKWVGTQGAVLFQRDKLVGTINQQEATMIAWLKGKLRNPTITVKIGPKQEKVSVGLHKVKHKIRPRLRKNQVDFQIVLTGKAHIISADTKQDITRSDIVKEIEQALENQVSNHLIQALKKSQRVQADILQLGTRIEWWYPKQWANLHGRWKTYYRDQVTFQIEPQIRIQHFGTEYRSVDPRSK